jgi:hypothetical protein
VLSDLKNTQCRYFLLSTDNFNLVWNDVEAWRHAGRDDVPNEVPPG